MRIFRFLSLLLLLFGFHVAVAASPQTDPLEAKLYPYVREKESDESKPLTFKLFGLTDAGPVEVDED